jgi:hypothetical protein
MATKSKKTTKTTKQTKAAAEPDFELSPKEVKLIIESLTHCLGTCQKGGRSKCTDCKAAEKVKAKLERVLAA